MVEFYVRSTSHYGPYEPVQAPINAGQYWAPDNPRHRGQNGGQYWEGNGGTIQDDVIIPIMIEPHQSHRRPNFQIRIGYTDLPQNLYNDLQHSRYSDMQYSLYNDFPYDRYNRPFNHYNDRYRSDSFIDRYPYDRFSDLYGFTRRRPAEFQYPQIGYGHSSFSMQIDQFRERYYREFRERQMMAMERRANRGRDGRSVPQPEIVEQERPPARDYENELPDTPPGYEAPKWNDPNHETPKYEIGRAIAADLLPVLREIPTKAEQKVVAEQFLRSHRHLIEKDGLKVLGFSGEKVLIHDTNKREVYVADAVTSIGNHEIMRPGWGIINDPRQYNVAEFRP